MKPTKRNHYNPCFWTAFWSPDYYHAFLHDSSHNLEPRNQVVNALNVKSDKIRSTSVDNIHFEKSLGWAEITFEAAKTFAKRHHPDKYEDFLSRTTDADYPVYIDFEDILTHIEQLPPYRVLFDVIRRQDIASPEEKAFIASFVYFQFLRCHAIMSSMLEWNAQVGIEKFEYFVMLKWSWSNPNLLYPLVAYLATSLWTLYRTSNDTFPLTDSPVLVRPDSVMIALSPRLLLEISPNIRAGEAIWRVRDDIERAKLAEFQRRTIGNTFREIIFGNKAVLEHWQASREFRKRVVSIRKMRSYNMLVSKRRGQELWLINALGNQ